MQPCNGWAIAGCSTNPCCCCTRMCQRFPWETMRIKHLLPSLLVKLLHSLGCTYSRCPTTCHKAQAWCQQQPREELRWLQTRSELLRSDASQRAGALGHRPAPTAPATTTATIASAIWGHPGGCQKRVLIAHMLLNIAQKGAEGDCFQHSTPLSTDGDDQGLHGAIGHQLLQGRTMSATAVKQYRPPARILLADG